MSRMPVENVGQCGSDLNSQPSNQIRMSEFRKIYRFSRGIAINLSDPIGQSNLIEKLPCARSDIFLFNFIAIPWRPVA